MEKKYEAPNKSKQAFTCPHCGVLSQMNYVNVNFNGSHALSMGHGLIQGNNQINKSKKANNDNIKTLVIEAAKKYVSDNVNDFDSDEYCIPISELESNNYIEESIIATGDDISNMGIIYKNNNYSIAKCESGGS